MGPGQEGSRSHTFGLLTIRSGSIHTYLSTHWTAQAPTPFDDESSSSSASRRTSTRQRCESRCEADVGWSVWEASASAARVRHSLTYPLYVCYPHYVCHTRVYAPLQVSGACSISNVLAELKRREVTEAHRLVRHGLILIWVRLMEAQASTFG